MSEPELTASVRFTKHDDGTATVVFDHAPLEALEEWLTPAAKEQLLAGIRAEIQRRHTREAEAVTRDE